VKCTYIIPYLAASDSLKAAIAHVLKDPEAQVVAVKDERADAAKSEADKGQVAQQGRLHLIADGLHKGYSRAVNLGIAHARATGAPQVLCIVNDDVGFAGEAPPQLGGLPDNAGLIGVLSNRAGYQSLMYSFDETGDFLYPDLPAADLEIRFEGALKRLGPRYMPVPLVHGFCFFVRPEVLDRIGDIDEGAFPNGYGSDFDLSMRAGAASYQNYVWSGACVWHQGARSAGRDQRRIRSIGADFVLKKRYGAAYADARFKTRNRMRIHLGNLVDFT
jgi:GT2 family glycosyltransferase